MINTLLQLGCIGIQTTSSGLKKLYITFALFFLQVAGDEIVEKR